MLNALRADLAIIKERDPAARGVLEILCCYPGLHALTLHRFSHRLWQLRWPLTPYWHACSAKWADGSQASKFTRAPRSAGACSSTTAWAW